MKPGEIAESVTDKSINKRIEIKHGPDREKPNYLFNKNCRNTNNIVDTVSPVTLIPQDKKTKKKKKKLPITKKSEGRRNEVKFM